MTDAELATTMRDLAWSNDDADRIAYSRDLWPRHHLAIRAGHIDERRPRAIVWPESTADVARLVRWAHDTGTPIVPFGAGSGVCGGVLPDARTVVLDLKRMSRWRALDMEGRTLEVEAGQIGSTLEQALERRGLTLGHFPSSIMCSTVGGWIAARSAGQCSSKYGKIEDMVLGLECVTGTGEILRLRHRTHGPNLLPLVVGSEGTLAIVTSATLRLHPAPAHRALGAFTFRSTEHGWEAMRALFQAGYRPAVCRLYDPFDAMLARRGSVSKRGVDSGHAPGLGAAALRTLLQKPALFNELLESRLGDALFGGALLVVIFEGALSEAEADLEAARTLFASLGGRWEGQEPAARWLSHRYAVSYRQAPIFAAGLFSDTMEVAAPWSKLGALYRDVRRALGEHVFVMAHMSHAYADGCCIYFTFAGSASRRSARALDQDSQGWDARCEQTYDKAWRRALEAAERAGGTIAHHHGVGRSKAPRLASELGPGGIAAIGALMRAFDPKGILNPGNLVARATAAAAVPR
jgi:alkyldihydroxyacetonephosphate synthase